MATAVPERSLPIAAEQREFSVLVEGQPVPREHQLLSASVTASANHLATARLVYADGSAAAGDFPLAAGDLFVPGSRVEVRAGSGSAQTSIFSGIVLRIRVRVREQAAPQLIVDCRHAAGRLASRPRSANHFDVTDSEWIEQRLADAGLDAEVQATAVRHAQLVQHAVSDWDFLVARAQANGLVVLTRGAQIALRRPALQGEPLAQLRFGATLLDFDAETDARGQAQAVHARSWSATDQALQEVESADPEVTAPGNLEGSELAAAAGVERLDLQHPGWTRDEAQALADAWTLRARLNQVCGRAKCIGLPQLQPGDVAELAGVGARFNGRIWVSGVRHELDTVQGFRTHLQFGSLDADEALLQRLAQPRSPALVAQVAGLQCGVVTDLEDPTGEARVRVRLPLVDAEDDGLWARVATLDAGDGRGFQFRPELGDEVLLGFLGNDPRHPVILGMLHSSAKAPPLPLANDNPQKGYVSRSGMRLHFDDDKSILTLSTPSGHSLQLDDESGALTLQDAHGNRIVLDSGGITLDSAGALQLNAGTEAHVEAQTSLSVKATLDLTLEGSASAELKGGALAKVNAALVQIN